MFGASIPLGLRCFCCCCFCWWCFLFLFFFSSFYWLESSVRGFRFFREVFVFFGVWIVLCPPEGSILSLSIQCLAPFLGIGRNYRTCMSKSSGFATSMRKNSGFLRFFDMGFDLTTSGRERFPYPLYYWSCWNGKSARLFLSVYKCGYLRALTVMFGASILLGFRCCFCFWVVLLFLLFVALLHALMAVGWSLP